jgi:hypothetical protein
MPNYASPGEAVRENYRQQGEQRTIERILEDLLADTIIAHDMPMYLLERVRAVVKGDNV